MKKIELDFDRPRALQADGPPERRGLKRDEVRLLVSTEKGHEHARFRDLPRFLAPYRFYFHPVRYTSLGLSLCEAMAITSSSAPTSHSSQRTRTR